MLAPAIQTALLSFYYSAQLYRVYLTRRPLLFIKENLISDACVFVHLCNIVYYPWMCVCVCGDLSMDLGICDTLVSVETLPVLKQAKLTSIPYISFISNFWASLCKSVALEWQAETRCPSQAGHLPHHACWRSLLSQYFCHLASCPQRANLPPCHLATSGHFLYWTVYLWQAEPTHYFFSLITLHHIPSWPF